MERREINWTRTAFIQKEMIIQYWNNHNRSNEYSLKLSALLDERLLLIASFPEIGIFSDFPNTRVIAIHNFSIFYKFDNKQILVTTIWDNRQNPFNISQKLISKPKQK
jgi:hypothetical protein